MGTRGRGAGLTVVRALAPGGIADLFLAREHHPVGASRLVVVKQLRVNYQRDRTFRQMFLDEARLALTLEHPSIVRALHAGVWHERLYIAFEHLAGTDLVRYTEQQPRGRWPTLSLSLTVARNLFAALDHVHRLTLEDGTPMGLVHRDVSPHNLFLCRDGSVKLIDFGVASFAQRAAPVTARGTVKGKVRYMSPEQLRGEPIDARSDLFSAGVVLYELTTGRRPFAGRRSSEALRRMVDEPLPSPSEVRPGFPLGLEQLLMELMARDPDRRPAHAAQVRDRIEQLARDLDLALGPHEVADALDEIPWHDATAEQRARGAQLTAATLEQTAAEAGPSAAAPARVLVVDDEESVHRVLRNHLRRFQPVSAYCASQALDALEADRFDAVVLDLNLPDHSGLSLLDRLRSRRPAPPVLILTAVADVSSAVEAMRRGAADYLVKSHETYSNLAGVLERVLRGRRAVPTAD